jgi:hypothetical protein
MAAGPPHGSRSRSGDYIVEVDGNKFPFPATEGEVFEVKAQ